MEKKEFYKHNLPHFQLPGQAYFVTWSLKDAVPKKALIRYTRKLELLKSQILGFKRPGAAVSGCSDFRIADSIMRGSESAPPIKERGSETLPDGQAGAPPGYSDSGAANSNSLDFKKCGSETAPPIKPRGSETLPDGQAGASPDNLFELEKLKKEYYSLRRKYIKAYDDLLDAERNPHINLSKPELTIAIIETLMFWEGVKLENYAFCVMPNHVHWVFRVFEKDKNGEPVYLQDILYSVKRFSANRINSIENRKGELWQKESFDTTIRDEKHLYYAIEYTLNNPVAAGLVKRRKDWPGSRGAADSGAAVSEPLD